MPRHLSFRQRLTGYDGRATGQAKLALGALVAVAFATGFLLHPGGAKPAAQVAASSLDGEVAGASGSPEAQKLGLRAAASLPALSGPAKRPSRRRAKPKPKPKPNPATVATPVVSPAATPEDTSAPAVDTPPPAAAAPVPTAVPPAPQPDPPSGEIFDSSG